MQNDNHPKQHNDKETIYGEMLYSLLTEMNGSLMTQVRSINNNEANILKAISELREALQSLNMGLQETRDKRHQEEIEALELQMTNLQKLLETKKQDVTQAPGATSEKIRTLAEQAATKMIETEKRKNEIDWVSVKKDTIKLLIGGFSLALFWYILPLLGKLLQDLAH